MPKIETRDLAALVLAGGVSITVILLGISSVVHSTSISISEATLLGTVLGTAVGGLATFLGFRAGRDSNIVNQADQTWPTPPAPPSVRPQ
jgi:hypothetical protein